MQFSSSGFPLKSNKGVNKWRVSFKRNWMKVKNLRIKQRKNTEQMKLYIQRAKIKKLLWHSLFSQQSEQWKFPKFWGKKVCSTRSKRVQRCSAEWGHKVWKTLKIETNLILLLPEYKIYKIQVIQDLFKKDLNKSYLISHPQGNPDRLGGDLSVQFRKLC